MKSGVFPAQLQQARVLPLLKKPSLDPDVATSYRLISYLSYLSKLIERVVAILASLSSHPLTIFCQFSSLLTDRFTRPKQQ